ncbi:hypothetical protein C900_00872 [Fulvivirga imtechensis AK7]|uniref:HMA domain-containing protein n=1 Tax=Fulvivirga imtechensis AK7 TaxID=1237149 RepID=L8JV63_9BACT|nr:hypothetical protein [Fulvivirga imtechensis]ELR72911.1 hypothetical protein C900_00872 [Fulvivirga imtechensis AK7]
MVEVFKTDIDRKEDAERVFRLLSYIFPLATINFDLEDVDNILRVECKNRSVDFDKLMRVVEEAGFKAEVLEDHQPVVGFL